MDRTQSQSVEVDALRPLAVDKGRGLIVAQVRGKFGQAVGGRSRFGGIEGLWAVILRIKLDHKFYVAYLVLSYDSKKN